MFKPGDKVKRHTDRPHSLLKNKKELIVEEYNNTKGSRNNLKLKGLNQWWAAEYFIKINNTKPKISWL